MKTTIKIFSTLIFLVFFMPMFQTCSDSSILKWQLPDETIVDSTVSDSVLKQMNDSLKIKNQKEKDSKLNELKREYTLNAYELGLGSFREFEVRFLKDWTFYSAICFTISILISLVILIKAIKEKLNPILKLSYLNLVFVICSVLILILKFGVEIVDQIRYGYYFLILNILVIISLSKIQINRNSG